MISLVTNFPIMVFLLSSSHVTVADQIVYTAIATHYTETYQMSTDPSFPVRKYYEYKLKVR